MYILPASGPLYSKRKAFDPDQGVWTKPMHMPSSTDCQIRQGCHLRAFQTSRWFRQLKSPIKSFWDQFFTEKINSISSKCPCVTPFPNSPLARPPSPGVVPRWWGQKSRERITWALADPGGPGGLVPPCPKKFSESCSFQEILREKPQFWANFMLRAPPPGNKSPLGPTLTKKQDPPLVAHTVSCYATLPCVQSPFHFLRLSTSVETGMHKCYLVSFGSFLINNGFRSVCAFRLVTKRR